MPRKKAPKRAGDDLELAMRAFQEASQHYARLSERRDQLISEIAQIDAALAKLRSQFGGARGTGPGPRKKAPKLQTKKAPSAAGGAKKKRAGRGGGPPLRDVIADVLRSRGALSLNEVYDALAQSRPGVSKKTVAVTLANMRNAGQLTSSGARRKYKYALVG